MWMYLTAPFSFTLPGFTTVELSQWEEDGPDLAAPEGQVPR